MAGLLTYLIWFLGVALFDVEGKCEDHIINCQDYSPDFCGQYPQWATTNCKKWCNFCLEGCPSGWRLSQRDKTCLKSFNDTYNWRGAQTVCRQNAGSLVMIKNASTKIKINGMRLTKSLQYWTGLKNMVHGDVDFRYLDGTRLTDYTNWNKDQPHNYTNGEYCVVYLPPDSNWSQNGGWSGINCSEKHPFICQKPLQ